MVSEINELDNSSDHLNDLLNCIRTPGGWNNVARDIVPAIITQLPLWPENRQLIINVDACSYTFPQQLAEQYSPLQLRLNNEHYTLLTDTGEVAMPYDGDSFYRAILMGLACHERAELLEQPDVQPELSSSIQRLRHLVANFISEQRNALLPVINSTADPDNLFSFLQEGYLEEAEEFMLKGYNSKMPEVDANLLPHLRKTLADVKSHLCLRVDRDRALKSVWLLEQIRQIERFVDRLSDGRMQGWISQEVTIKSSVDPNENVLGSRCVAQSLTRRLESTLKTLIQVVTVLRAIDDYSTPIKIHGMLVKELTETLHYSNTAGERDFGYDELYQKSVASAPVQLMHVVKPGDTFKSIAKFYYGDESLDVRIRYANAITLEKNKLSPGLRLYIPRNDAVVIYHVEKGDTLRSIAKKIYTDEMQCKRIFAANSDILENENDEIPLGTKLYIPVYHQETFYRVKVGETFEIIAKRIYNDPGMKNILYEVNKDILGDFKEPLVGQRIYLPGRFWITNHTVKQGDTLSSISMQYYGDDKQSVRIRHANKNLIDDSGQLRAGQVLVIPKYELRAFYKVKPGDTLNSIAKQAYADENRSTIIFQANRHILKNKSDLAAGQTLFIPKYDWRGPERYYPESVRSSAPSV